MPPGRLGSYPTIDGDVTVGGRRQQVAVAAWVLGWLGGPIPALLALAVTRPPRSHLRSTLIGALVFWAALSTTMVVVVVGLDGWSLAIAWSGLSVVALAVTALAVRHALRRVGPADQPGGGG